MTKWEHRANIYAGLKTLEFFERRKSGRLQPLELRAMLVDAFLDGANERHGQRIDWDATVETLRKEMPL